MESLTILIESRVSRTEVWHVSAQSAFRAFGGRRRHTARRTGARLSDLAFIGGNDAPLIGERADVRGAICSSANLPNRSERQELDAFGGPATECTERFLDGRGNIDSPAACLRRYARPHAIQGRMQIVIVEVHKQLLQDAVPNPVFGQHRR